MKKIKVALIDSGIDFLSNGYLNGQIIDAYCSPKINSGQDTLGHGTAISHIILKQLSESIIYSVKIFDELLDTSEDDLVEALNYIYENLDVDIIHISNGLNCPQNLSELKQICKKITNKGISIVSAADNLGVISYPAALENVIGVYWDKYIRNVNEYIFVENSPINVLGYSGKMLVPWIGNERKTVSGSSFTAPYITAKIGRYLLDGNNGIESISSFLMKNAIKVIVKEDKSIKFNNNIINNVEKINNAILFPINKEMHSLIGNADLLDFNIVDIYDHPMSRNIGKETEEVIYGKSIVPRKIKSVNEINWSSNFDTIILGHTNELNKLFNRNYINHFLNKAKEYGKNIYCFDELESSNEKSKNSDNFFISPYIKENEITIDSFGSLHRINKPVVSIVGTSPKQGKFTLQLSLRRILMNMGYSIGQLGTEPSSSLFGMDITFPNGYDSVLDLTPNQEIFYLNKSISTLNEKDLVIIGTQSQTIPYSFGNLGFYPLEQNRLLLAAEPDATIICINYEDEITYIERTINYLKSFIQTEVIALVIYPKESMSQWNINITYNDVVSKEALVKYQNKLRMHFDIPIFINGENDLLIAEECINFFT